MRIHWPWVFIAYASLFVFGLTDNLRGPVFPELLDEFQVSHSRGSLFFVVASILTMIGAFSVPRILRSWGHIPTLCFFMSLLFVSQLGFYFARTFDGLLLFSAAFGLAIGGLGVVQNLLVLIATPVERRQRVQSGLHACYGASSFLAPGMVILVSFFGGSWRANFALAALLIVFFFGLLRFLHRHSAKGFEVPKPPETSFPRVEAWYMAIVLALYVSTEILVASRLALFMRIERDVDLATSSAWVFLFFAGLFLGRVVFSFYQPPLSLGAQMKLSLFSTMVLIALSVVSGPEWLALSGITMAPFYPLTMTAMSLLFGGHVDRTAAVAVALSGITVVGMHAAVGVISDHFSLKTAFLVGLGLAGLPLIMLFLYRRFFGRALP